MSSPGERELWRAWLDEEAERQGREGLGRNERKKQRDAWLQTPAPERERKCKGEDQKLWIKMLKEEKETEQKWRSADKEPKKTGN